MDILERMKEEVAEAQRVADKHKAAASHIKEQLREVGASATHDRTHGGCTIVQCLVLNGPSASQLQ